MANFGEPLLNFFHRWNAFSGILYFLVQCLILNTIWLSVVHYPEQFKCIFKLMLCCIELHNCVIKLLIKYMHWDIDKYMLFSHWNTCLFRLFQFGVVIWPALHVEFPSLAKLKFNAQIFRNKNRQRVAAHANLSAIFDTTADSCPIGKALAVSFVQFGL